MCLLHVLSRVTGGCTKCTGFNSSFTCGCGVGHREHRMVVETAEEREARGHPVGQAVPYAAMAASPASPRWPRAT